MCEQEKANDGEPVFFEEVWPREKAGFSRRNDFGQKEEKKSSAANSASVAKFWIRSRSKVCCKVATFASSKKKFEEDGDTVIEREPRSIHLSSFFAHLE